MPIIAITNQKGGVGKTTTTLNLGAALQAAGKRVLLVDLDPQGNLSVATGLSDVDEIRPSIGDVLAAYASKGRKSLGPRIQDAIVHTPAGLDLVPSNANLAAAELQLVCALGRESALAHVLRPAVQDYDVVLIDCLPSLGLTAINALAAADGVIIPVQSDFLAVQGLAHTFETVAAVRQNLNPALEIYGVLLTLVDQRTSHARSIAHSVRDSLDGDVRVFEAEIKLQVVQKECSSLGQSVLDLAPDSLAAATYRELATEVLQAMAEPLEEAELEPAWAEDKADLEKLIPPCDVEEPAPVAYPEPVRERELVAASMPRREHQLVAMEGGAAAALAPHPSQRERGGLLQFVAAHSGWLAWGR